MAINRNSLKDIAILNYNGVMDQIDTFDSVQDALREGYENAVETAIELGYTRKEYDNSRTGIHALYVALVSEDHEEDERGYLW